MVDASRRGQRSLIVGSRPLTITEKTGGDFIHSGDPGSDFQESMRRIRSRYSIYYGMPQSKPGARRSLHVELSAEAARRNPKARVRARTGYLTPAKP